jgi:hypothetical protein
VPDKQKLSIPAGMEKVHRRFERWRKTRRGRAPIPKRLWVAAASLAREYGVNPTSKALGLEFNKLRAFVESGRTARKRAKRRMTAAPRFLELVTAPAGVSECVIELEGRRGKMRIEWKGSAAPDLAGLSRMLWERE